MNDPALFEGLTKLPEKPALPILARAKVKLDTQITLDAGASIGEMLQALDAQRGLADTAEVDMIKLLAQAMPKREAVWWSCLAARDIVGHKEELKEGCLFTAEAWVFKPTDDNRRAAFAALQAADPDDPASLAAMGAVYASGTYGPDELEDAEVPPGVFGHVIFGQVLTSMDAMGEADTFDWFWMLIERALDIAKGGNGKSVPVPEPVPEPA